MHNYLVQVAFQTTLGFIAHIGFGNELSISRKDIADLPNYMHFARHYSADDYGPSSSVTSNPNFIAMVKYVKARYGKVSRQ